jgi:hypothetical protein
MADTPIVTATASPTAATDPTLQLLGSMMGSGTAKGAALGALMSNLLQQYSTPGGVLQPLDMSKSLIQGRTTDVSPVRYVPYSQYGTRDLSAGMTPEQERRFGAVSGLRNLVSPAALSAAPAFVSAQQPMSFTSAGSGRQVMPMLSLTPKGTNTISPLTGALLGAAAGYFAPSGSTATTSGGTTSGGISAGTAAGELWDRIIKGLTPSYSGVVSGSDLGSQTFPVNQDLYSGSTDTTNWNDPGYDYLSNMQEYGIKDGGMVSPLMAANGGAVESPSFYTYGTAVDPRQIMNGAAQGGMAQGGMAHGGLHVPVVEGRHDYRAGARVTGAGDGQSDDIPAMLADGEYVIDAETVAQLGNGSTKAGSDLLDKFREEIRNHKRSAPVDKIPPPSKSPLQYLKQAQSRSKKNG